jgi:glycosyltransferase involved in cell wall biosynthesis
MPICVLEALGTGLPVVTMDVGEVNRVIFDGKNGEILKERNTKAFTDAIIRNLSNKKNISGTPCVNSIQDYVPQKVLKPLYENYYRLANLKQ